ncbi:MAG: adenylyltransferase/cytidyltransferase family protein [Gammaproteobacteria bacterium]|nr:adenylyltransferase/cytidyltransferase family protein [Gammaproteobacteria bacterium]MDD9799985.1 adenylyltransferase/cytidyltransferase family protein [Gammaproteobacteria bacterium]MDD9815781.1 adenylyltransferase/cytidyltransferase family protein [Gammaproteobacteria bacterium]MDD9851522.1 adenylyltransferase/cytidyltransferase family protein [Gammaproteobacteria bacterium]MDD9870870.1 adenylyltransferase/cytidyltransferase family protein [Gammaproteobacteria bacterium]
MKSRLKIAPPAEFERRVATLPRPLVFTNGCFDILHRGHAACLEEAAALGRSLVVAVNDDASAARLGKGEGRPFNNCDARMAVLAALACVDLVTPFSDDTPVALIKKARPQHLAKGGDWPADQIAGAAWVRANGGEVHRIPHRHRCSTSALIEKIRGAKH